MLQNKSVLERWEIIDKLLPLGCYETEVAAIKAHHVCSRPSVSTAGVRAACPFSNVVNMAQILLYVSQSPFRSLI